MKRAPDTTACDSNYAAQISWILRTQTMEEKHVARTMEERLSHRVMPDRSAPSSKDRVR